MYSHGTLFTRKGMVFYVMKELLEFVTDNWLSLFILIPIFIQISPIKVNPLEWIGRHLLSDLNRENNRRMDDLKKEIKSQNGELRVEIDKTNMKLDELSMRVDDNEIDRIRWEILTFSNSLQHGAKHTKDEFIHIIEINDKYHKILQHVNKTNGVLDAEFVIVHEKYLECCKNNSFLPVHTKTEEKL